MINLKGVIGMMVLYVLIAEVYCQTPGRGGPRGGKPDFEFGGGGRDGRGFEGGGRKFGQGLGLGRGYGRGRGGRRRGCQDDDFLQKYQAKCSRFNSTATVTCGDFDTVHDCLCVDGNCMQIKARLGDDARCQCLHENGDPVLGFNGQPLRLRHLRACYVTETCDCSYANLLINEACTVESTQP